MARQFFAIEKGLRVFKENSDTLYVDYIFDAGAPAGTSGETDAAPIGSLYSDTTNGKLYVKKTDTSLAADWVPSGDVTIDELAWRSEKVRFATNDTIAAGSVDITALSDNDDMVYGDIAVGEYVIGDLDGSPALFEVTATPGSPNITVAAAGQAIASNDTFVVQQYLPDPSGQENAAIVHIPVAGSAGIKISDVDWNFADGINMASGYAAVNGSVSSADSVNSAIEKLDGNQQDIQTASGLAQGDTDYGTFTGDIIPDSSTSKGALQSLETELVDTRQNVDDLITLSGVAENSTDLGAFTGFGAILLTATETVKSAIQKISDFLGGLRKVQATGITTLAAVDSVPHASMKHVLWHYEAFEEATPANRKSGTIEALTDGTSVDDTDYGKLKLGANFNLVLAVAINGANMELRASSSTAGVTVNVRRIEVTS